MTGSRRLLAIAALAAAAACGKRGDPQPPVRVVPQPVTEFRLAQRGAAIEISGLAPSVTTTGARLPVLDLQLQRATGPGDFDRLAVKSVRKLAPGEAFLESDPLPAPGTLVRAAATAAVGGRASRRTTVLSLTTWAPLAPPSGLTASLTAAGVALQWTPAPAQPSPPPVAPGTPAQPGAAASPPPAGHAAGPSPPPGASPASPPSPAAGGLPASPTADAVEAGPSPAHAASATAAPATPAGSGPAAPGASASPSPVPSPRPTPLPAGFWIYRRAKAGAYGRPLQPELVAGPTYLDAAVQAGEDWCYAVRFVAQAAPPVESDASNEACVGVRDIAAPAAPAGLALIQGPQGVEISWTSGAEPDLAGYRVYRAVEPSTVEQAVVRAEIAKETTVFRDGDLSAGLVHAYFVVAVDTAGNESPRSEILQVRP